MIHNQIFEAFVWRPLTPVLSTATSDSVHVSWIKLSTEWRRSGPDVSHTLHMWLWLTFHLPPSLYPFIHPSLLTSLSGCQRCFLALRECFTKVCFSSQLWEIYPVSTGQWQFAACSKNSLFLKCSHVSEVHIQAIRKPIHVWGSHTWIGASSELKRL